MIKLFLCLSAMALYATGAQAQTVPQYCNGAAIYDTSVIGSVKLVGIPTIGGIYLCGFSIAASSITNTVGVRLTFSTAGVVNSSGSGGTPLVTGAAQTGITPVFQFITSTSTSSIIDHDASYTGLFVPSGNQLNLTTSLTTGPVQALIYFWTQNP